MRYLRVRANLTHQIKALISVARVQCRGFQRRSIASVEGPVRRTGVSQTLAVTRAGLNHRGRDKADHSATYFSHSNAAGNLAREKLAEESLESLISWLKAEGNVGIMGASDDKGARPC
jgi:hypothetical protein